jgi:16S rRNA (adenine1518-N6/adenine1519-N6)-dimethyltransferase
VKTLDKISSPRKIKEIMDKHGFRLSKSLGQNFLIDENILKKIVDIAKITGKDFIIEVGPVIGSHLGPETIGICYVW